MEKLLNYFNNQVEKIVASVMKQLTAQVYKDALISERKAALVSKCTNWKKYVKQYSNLLGIVCDDMSLVSSSELANNVGNCAKPLVVVRQLKLMWSMFFDFAFCLKGLHIRLSDSYIKSISNYWKDYDKLNKFVGAMNSLGVAIKINGVIAHKLSDVVPFNMPTPDKDEYKYTSSKWLEIAKSGNIAHVVVTIADALSKAVYSIERYHLFHKVFIWVDGIGYTYDDLVYFEEMDTRSGRDTFKRISFKDLLQDNSQSYYERRIADAKAYTLEKLGVIPNDDIVTDIVDSYLDLSLADNVSSTVVYYQWLMGFVNLVNESFLLYATTKTSIAFNVFNYYRNIVKVYLKQIPVWENDRDLDYKLRQAEIDLTLLGLLGFFWDIMLVGRLTDDNPSSEAYAAVLNFENDEENHYDDYSLVEEESEEESEEDSEDEDEELEF